MRAMRTRTANNRALMIPYRTDRFSERTVLALTSG